MGGNNAPINYNTLGQQVKGLYCGFCAISGRVCM